MAVTTTTHLNFRGDARAVPTFYQSVFGGDLTTVTYADAHAVQDPAEADQVMYGQVEAPGGFRVMAWEPGTIPVFVSVRGPDAGEITRAWEGLSDGATVVQPLAPSGWAPLYGMLWDRFGVTWVLDVAVAYAPARPSQGRPGGGRRRPPGRLPPVRPAGRAKPEPGRPHTAINDEARPSCSTS